MSATPSDGGAVRVLAERFETEVAGRVRQASCAWANGASEVVRTVGFGTASERRAAALPAAHRRRGSRISPPARCARAVATGDRAWIATSAANTAPRATSAPADVLGPSAAVVVGGEVGTDLGVSEGRALTGRVDFGGADEVAAAVGRGRPLPGNGARARSSPG